MLNLRDDIVLEKVCGVYVLVALRSAWGTCPFALQIAPYAAYFWDAMREGKSSEEILEGACLERGMDRKRAERAYQMFLKAAEENHYLVKESVE